MDSLFKNKIRYSIITIYIFVSFFGIVINEVMKYTTIFLLLLYSILYMLLKKKIKINSYIIWWIAIILFMTISLLYTDYFDTAFEYFTSSVMRLIMLFAIYQLVDSNTEFKDVLDIIKNVCLLAFIYALYNEITTFYIMGIGSTFGGRIVFSYTTIFGTIVAIYLFLKYKSRYNLLISIVLYTASLLTSGRKAMLIPILFLSLFLLIKNRNKASKMFISILVMVVVLVTFTYISLESELFYNILGYRLETFLGSFIGKDIIDESTMIRTKMIQSGFKLFKERPILGYGIDSYKLISGFEVYSHNNYIETLVSGGVIYFAIYYFLYLYAIGKYLFRKHIDVDDIFAISFIIILLIFDIGTITTFIYQINIILLFTMDKIFQRYSIKI